jgi:hypothetical protein
MSFFFQILTPGVLKGLLTKFRLSPLNRLDWTDIRACPTVRAKIRVDYRPIFTIRNRLKGTNREAVSTIGASFGNLVSHK